MHISRRRFCASAAAVTLLPLGAARAASAPIVNKIALTESRVWVAVKIGAAGPFLFIIDTGAHLSLIEETVARQLRLPVRSLTGMIGSGGKDVLPLYLAHDVIFGGGLRQNAVAFAGTDLPLGRDAAGSLAAGVLTWLDSDLDFEAAEWRVYPGGKRDRTGFVRAPSEIEHVGTNERGSAYIFAHAALDGHQERFVIDTGMPGAVSLRPAATRRSGLWDDERPYAPFRPHGIGGFGKLGRRVRAKALQIADILYPDPIVAISEPAQGSTPALGEGVIGLGVLRNLALSTDVGHRCLWVKANALPRASEHYNYSGLWLERSGDSAEVTDVGRKSPGEEAGIRRGDTVLGMGFDRAVQLLNGPAGSEVPLDMARGAGRFHADVKLRAFL
ncbi:MAG TPA: aspartyl protease family protein [Allosphingosinicella sp.]|jgi:serine protease Do